VSLRWTGPKNDTDVTWITAAVWAVFIGAMWDENLNFGDHYQNLFPVLRQTLCNMLWNSTYISLINPSDRMSDVMEPVSVACFTQ